MPKLSFAKNYLYSTDIKPYESLGIFLFFFLGFSFISASEFGRRLETNIARNLEFGVRHDLGLDPRVDPRIKIFAFDDRSVAAAGASDLTLEKWAGIYQMIAANQPAVILIDRYFGDPKGLERAAEFLKKMQQLGTKVVVGSIVKDIELSEDRKKIPKLQNHYFRSMVQDRDGWITEIEKVAWLDPAEKAFAYGPHKDIISAFPNIGHLYYEQDSYSFRSIKRLDKERGIPHWALFVAESLYFKDGDLHINSQTVDMVFNDTIPVNFPHPNALLGRGASMKGLIKRLERGLGYPKINRGDVVIILPAFYTGHTDWMFTPFGRFEGGLVQAAMVNSVLTNNWLRVVPGSVFWLMALTGLGMILGVRLKFRWAISVSAGLAIVLGVGSVLLFAYLSTIFPWLYCSASLVLCTAFVCAKKTIKHEVRASRIRNAMAGFVSEERLDAIARDPDSLRIKPSAHIVTAVFIDIVEYSLLSERLEPQEAFEELKQLLEALTSIIFRYGGTVDKTLGDGIFCYFGYRLDGSLSIDHAIKAVECAVDMQRTILERNLIGFDQGRPVYPLRIGINTTYAYIGDVGNERRPDITMIGEGVNFAQRLESACESYQIMIGPSTYDFAKDLDSDTVKITKRFIQIKHHDELMEAYEVDPFHGEAKLLGQAVQAYRTVRGIQRKDSRFPIPEECNISIRTDVCSGHMHNFSPGGFGAVLPKIYW